MKYAILAVLFVAESASAGLLAEITTRNGLPGQGGHGFDGFLGEISLLLAVKDDNGGVGEPTFALWVIGPVTTADEGTTYVASLATAGDYPSTRGGSPDPILQFDLLAEFLTNGDPQQDGLGNVISVGFEHPGTGPHFPIRQAAEESLLFAGFDNGDMRSVVFVPPPNGIDYEGFVIDQITMTLDVIFIEYDPITDVTWLGTQTTIGIYGTQIPAPSAVWLLLLWPLTMSRRRKP